MSWATSIFQFLATAVYNTVTPSPANGEQVPFQCDSAGRLRVAVGDASFTSGGAMRVTEDPAGLTWATSVPDAGLASATLKASAGTFYALHVTNGGGTDTWLHVMDGSARLVPPVKVPSGQTISIEYNGGRPFATSLTWAALVGADYTSGSDLGAALYTVAKYL